MLNYPCQVKEEVKRWIRDYFEENGKGCFAVIGISGGKDSSVAAALCVEAAWKSAGDRRIDAQRYTVGYRGCEAALVKFLEIPHLNYKYRNDLCCLVSGIGTERSPSEHDR